MSLVDAHGRKINYLRLSVTDRCNLRCTYCMPAAGVAKLACDQVLRYEELLAVARAAVHVGIEKIRVTGGEPLVRKGLPAFLEQLAKLPGLRELVLTTNGVLLPELAQTLKDAGVQRLNISLDSLQPETFARDHPRRGPGAGPGGNNRGRSGGFSDQTQYGGDARGERPARWPTSPP